MIPNHRTKDPVGGKNEKKQKRGQNSTKTVAKRKIPVYNIVP